MHQDDKKGNMSKGDGVKAKSGARRIATRDDSVVVYRMYFA